MSRLHRILMTAALPLMTQPAASQVPAVHLDSAGARLEVTFPDLRFAELGRTPTGNRLGQKLREYSWKAWASFPDSYQQGNHLVLLAFEFDLPDTVELTPTRLDSIARAARVTVTELRGEPPIFGTPYQLRLVRVRRDRGGLHIMVQGREAVDGFLRTGVDSVAVSWYERRRGWIVRQVPLGRRRAGA